MAAVSEPTVIDYANRPPRPRYSRLAILCPILAALGSPCLPFAFFHALPDSGHWSAPVRLAVMLTATALPFFAWEHINGSGAALKGKRLCVIGFCTAAVWWFLLFLYYNVRIPVG